MFKLINLYVYMLNSMLLELTYNFSVPKGGLTSDMALPDENTKFILKTLGKKLPNLFREPLEWQPDFMIVEVEKNDDSTLIEKGTQILANVKQDNAIMTTTLNTSSVQIYEPIVDQFILKFQETTIIKGKDRYNWIIHNLALMIALLTNKLFLPKRAFYYTNRELFKNDHVILFV
ncbi:hypothetical protein TSUD_108270 [Trifolium subterraneum]|nr:hypothetical protein TSUD_108270 [Trifolium subterraneum]